MKNKSSGQRCIWSIISRKLADKLVEDGILNNPIARESRENSGDVVYYFNSFEYYYRAGTKWLNSRPADELLWMPSFIQPEVWEKSAKLFCPRQDLKYNVEHYLLPEMEEYVLEMTGEEKVSLIRDFLLEHDILNNPIRQISGSTYYFNDSEIYMLDKGSQLFPYEGRLKFHIFKIKDSSYFNMNVWAKAARQFKAGMTLAKCIQLFLDTELELNPAVNLSYIDELIQQIHAPEYERTPENTNEATFDRIRVIVGLPRFKFQSQLELKRAIQENQAEVNRRVLQRIESDRRFKKYNVPIQYIKLSEVMLKPDYSLEYIFEIHL